MAFAIAFPGGLSVLREVPNPYSTLDRGFAHGREIVAGYPDFEQAVTSARSTSKDCHCFDVMRPPIQRASVRNADVLPRKSHGCISIQ